MLYASIPNSFVSQGASAGESCASTQMITPRVPDDRASAKRCLKIFWFEIRHLLEDLLRGQSRRVEVEHIAHPDTHATDARPSPTLLRVHRDALGQPIHTVEYNSAAINSRPGVRCATMARASRGLR